MVLFAGLRTIATISCAATVFSRVSITRWPRWPVAPVIAIMVFSFVSGGCCGTLSLKLTFSKYVQKGKYEMTLPTLSEQLRDGNLFAEACPSRDVLKHVTSRWGVLILVALRDGTHRFSDLRRKMGGVSEKMLAQSLQALEQDGFIDRVSYPVVPS